LTKQAGSGSELGSDQLYPEPKAEAKILRVTKRKQTRKHDTSRGAGSKKYSTTSTFLVWTYRNTIMLQNFPQLRRNVLVIDRTHSFENKNIFISMKMLLVKTKHFRAPLQRRCYPQWNFGHFSK